MSSRRLQDLQRTASENGYSSINNCSTEYQADCMIQIIEKYQ